MALSKNRTLDLLRESYYSNYSKYNLQGSIKSPATKSVVFKDDEEKKKKDNTFWQDTGDFFEGVGYLGHKAGLGFINSLEGTVDYLSSGIAKLFGADALAEKILENDWLDYDAADDWFNPGQGWKIAGDVAGGIGTSLFSIGTGLFTGGAGVVISAGLSGAGNAARESYKESGKYGLNEFLYSSSVGALEGGLEAVLGAGTKWAKSLAKSMGLSIGKNAAKNAGKVVATTAKSALKKAGTEMFSEGMEEAITEFVSPYIKRVTYDKNAANATADEILYAGLVGGLSGLVMSGSVGAINQAGNIRKGNAIVKDGRASSVASLAETLVNVDKNSKYNKAIDDIYKRIAPAVNSGEKLNLNQRRALGELLQLETAAVFEPVIKRSAISVINSAEAVATRLNEYGTYKIVDGKLVNVKDSSFDTSGAEVRDITAEDITRGVVFENGKMLDTQSVADALQNNDVLRLVSASDAAGRLMMNAKETERAASFGSKIRSQEELRAFLAESTPEEKAALAKELQIEDLDSVGFEEFNQKALEYRESGKAEQFQERIRTKEQLQRLSVDNAKRMPIEIHLADGEMKRYSDGDSNISVVRNGNEYIVYDFKNGTLSQPLTKKRLDKILQRKKQIKKTQASDDKALALYEEKLQKKYDKDAPLREARARILAQMGVREETTVPNLNPDAKPQMNGVAPPNIAKNVAQNENAESNADLNTVTQSDASPYENYTNNEFSENAGKKSRGLMPLLESIADSFSSIGSSGGKTKSLRSVPSDERGAEMQPASETEANTTKNEDVRSNEKGETRSLLGVDAAKKFAESINAYRNAKNIAQEKIPDFDKMDDAKKEKTVSVLKNAVKKGVSAEDATMYARVSARSGLDIVFDKEACLRKVNGEEVYAAGFYDPENNRIVVNPDAKKKHASLLIHELSHAIRSYVGKDNKIHYISDKNAKISDELWEKVKKHYSDQNVDVTRMELMLDEASAYYAEEILGTDAAIDLLLGKKKTLKEKILSFFKGAARDYAGDAALSKEARKFLRTFKKMFDAFAEKNRMAEANVQKEDADKTKISGNASDARFSLEFADKIAEDQRKYIKDHSQAITESELNKAIKDTDEMVDTMIDHKKILPEDKVGKTLVKNGSYDVSVENTTICVRTLSYNTFVDMVSEKIGRPLSQMESFLVSQKLYDIAKEPQCLYCYVSLDRKAYNDMILRYIDQRDAAIKAYEEAGRPNVTRSSKLYEDFRNKRADTDSMWDRYKGWIDAYKKGEKLLTAKDVATEARRVALVEGKDASAAAQVKDILKYAQSASWAKKQTKYVAYNGEILKLGNNVIKNLNKHYGLRWYSFSDYSGAFIVENMQQITDASLRGLKGLSYTKDTDFAKIFAPTGMNINISVYATKDGKGGYTIDEKQSANIDEAIALRKKYPNVGIVVVATDAAGVEWALDQKWSDVVIPFHTVRTGQQVAEFYDWTVFNEEQNDSVKNENLWNEYVRNVTKGDAKASKKVSKMVYPSEHQNNRETYLRLIEERGLKPRFASFLDNPNYMKLVNETRQSESQTSPLKPVYDVDAAKQSFDKFVDKGGYYEGWYNDGIDVDGEAEIVASDIRAGKKANEVDYGRQDQRGNPTPSPEAIMAQRKTNRAHGSDIRAAAEEGSKIGTKNNIRFAMDEVENPDIRRSFDKEAFTSPTIGNVAKSRFDEPKPKMKEKIKASFISAKDKLYIEGVDELYGVEKYLKKFGGRKDAPEFLQQVRASETIAQSMIGVAQYDITSGDGTRLGDGITKIFKPYNTRKIANQFNDYLLHQLNVDRMSLHETSLNMKKELEAAFKKAKMAYDAAEKRMKSGEIKSIPDNITKKYNSAKLAFESYEVIEDKPVFDKNETREKAITAEESKKIIAEYEKKYPSFKEDAEKVWNYSKNLLNMRVNAGLISQSSADLMMRYYPHYVPSFRENKKSVGAGTVKNNSQLAVNSTVKRAKGGGEDIYSIEESLAAQTRQAIRAMKINEMANAVYDAAIKSGDTSYVIAEEVDTETNTDPDKDVDVDLIPKNNQIAFLKNGKRIEMNVSQEIFDGFKGVTSGSVPDMFVARMANSGVNLFKNLVTSYSPAFSARNIVRDVQDALINSRHSALFSKNVLLAINGIIKNDALWQKYLAYGGYASTVFDAKGFTNGVGGRGFESFVKLSEIDGNALKKLPAAAKNILVGIGNANAFVEQVTRFAEFRASIEAGDSIQTAINNSADVTTNFSRHGKTVKVLNATFIPFLNASVQGFDKLYRTLTDPIREKSLKALAMLLAKIFTVGVGFQIINMIMNADDEDYYDLTDEVRENYFLIKVGDQFLKIPRGRAAAAFGGIANRIGNEMRGDDFDVSGYLKSLKDNVTPVDSFSRNILSPLNDVATNTTWYGGEIEGRQFDNVRPSQRYDESTSSIAIWIGDKFNYSPKKIHYLMDQYSGVIGDFLLPMTSKKAEKDYLSANFLIDSSTNNKLSGDFYKLYDEATYATEEGDMTAYYQLRHLNDVKDSVSKIYKEINEIQASDMKSTEKLQQVRTLRILVNNLYRTAALDYDTYTKAIEATDGMFDDSNASGKRDRHVAITKMTFGSEKALEEYNATVYEKSTLFNKAGISYDTYYEYYFSVRDLESDLDRKGEVIEGSKRKKVIQAINSLGTSAQEKLLMICASGYAIKDGDIRGYSAERAKQTLYRYIKAMNVSEEERIKLAEACGFKVKNGRILIN